MEQKTLGGYKNLLVYRLSVTIFDFTVVFCDRYLSDLKFKRTVEQMVQAGRSGKQNIVEGSKEISIASEMMLTSVSRASYSELSEDYEDFLRQRHLAVWDKNDPRILKIRSFKEAIGMETDLSDLAKWTNLDFKSSENFANLMVCLCIKQGYLLDQLLRAKEQKFVKEGGFKENLYKKRQLAKFGKLD